MIRPNLQLRCRTCGIDFEFPYDVFVTNMEATGWLVTYPKHCHTCFENHNPGTTVGDKTYPNPNGPRFAQEFNGAWKPALYACDGYFAYILRLTDPTGKMYYIGHTDNISRRVQEHRRGSVVQTRGKDPKLVWFCELATRDEATSLEAELKSVYAQNAEIIDKIVNRFDYLMRDVCEIYLR